LIYDRRAEASSIGWAVHGWWRRIASKPPGLVIAGNPFRKIYQYSCIFENAFTALELFNVPTPILLANLFSIRKRGPFHRSFNDFESQTRAWTTYDGAMV